MLEKIFKIKENGSNIKTEWIAGTATFFSIAYIIFLAPSIISEGANGDPRMYNAIFIATCLAACIGTLCTALIANWPVVQAPGIATCGFFTYTVMIKLGYSYPVALFLNFLAGILFIICSVSGIREKIIKAIPQNLSIGIGVGIGIFIGFLGFKNSGLIVASDSTLLQFISFNPENFGTAQIAAILTIIGVIIIGILRHFDIKGSVLISMVTISILSALTGVTSGITKDSFVSLGTMFKDFWDLSFLAVFQGGSETWDVARVSLAGCVTLLVVVFCFFISTMFNTLGTLVAVASAAKLKDENGEIKNLPKALMSDAVGTTCGTLVGSPAITCYLESGVGVSEGGRTGLTATIAAIYFLLAIFLGPICKFIPDCATAPALIYVGILMLYDIKNITTEDITDLIPITLAILLIPFTCDIAIGIAVSFICYTILKVLTGKWKEVSPYMYVISVLFLFYFALL